MADEVSSNDPITGLSQKMASIHTNDNNENCDKKQLQNRDNISNKNITSINHEKIDYKDIKEQIESNNLLLPCINLPEKIMIIIDITRENNTTPFELRCGKKYDTLQIIKKTIEIFVRIKRTINNKHEYGLMILNGNSVKIICDYTNDGKKISSSLNEFEKNSPIENKENCDLTLCFDELLSHLSLELDTLIPSFINRVILIYTQSKNIPIFSSILSFDTLMKNKFFFFDVLFVHEPFSDDNKCEEVYSALNTFDVKQNSWIFEVGRNAAELYNSMAKLLAHPLQRPKQNNIDYKVFTSEISGIQTNV